MENFIQDLWVQEWKTIAVFVCLVLIFICGLLTNVPWRTRQSERKGQVIGIDSFDAAFLSELVRQQVNQQIKEQMPEIQGARPDGEKMAVRKQSGPVDIGDRTLTARQTVNIEKTGLQPGKPVADPYAKARQLADRGLDSEEIARMVSLPQSHVDLIVKLRRMANMSNAHLRPKPQPIVERTGKNSPAIGNNFLPKHVQLEAGA